MHEAEIREIVKATLDEERARHGEVMDVVVMKAVATILTSFGIEDDEKKEIRADFAHLRKWRKSVEQAQSYTLRTIITVLFGGVLGALWLGFKDMIHK